MMLDHLVGSDQKRLWHLNAEFLRRLKVDDELEFG
jgi:hypothetical protein